MVLHEPMAVSQESNDILVLVRPELKARSCVHDAVSISTWTTRTEVLIYSS